MARDLAVREQVSKRGLWDSLELPCRSLEADILYLQGDFNAAVLMVTKSLEDSIRVFGRQHPMTLQFDYQKSVFEEHYQLP
jgi:hypothetical protein